MLTGGASRSAVPAAFALVVASAAASAPPTAMAAVLAPVAASVMVGSIGHGASDREGEVVRYRKSAARSRDGTFWLCLEVAVAQNLLRRPDAIGALARESKRYRRNLIRQLQ